MPLELSKEETKEAVASLQTYFSQELDQEISEMRAKFLLDFLLREIAPLAYNQGVKDAESFFRVRVEDLSGTCFEEAFTYWQKKKK